MSLGREHCFSQSGHFDVKQELCEVPPPRTLPHLCRAERCCAIMTIDIDDDVSWDDKERREAKVGWENDGERADSHKRTLL